MTIKLNPNLDVSGPTVMVWEKFQHGGRTRPINKEVLFNLMVEVKEVFEKFKIRYCLSHGTMLGIYRDGDLITGDDDVDIAIFPDGDLDKFKVDFEVVREELINRGFFVPKMGNKNKPINGLGENYNMPYYDEVFLKDGEKIECWIFEKKGDFYIYDEPRCGNDLKHPIKYYDTLATYEWKGYVWPIPNHIEDWMVLMYSKSWRIPQSGRKYNNQGRCDYES